MRVLGTAIAAAAVMAAPAGAWAQSAQSQVLTRAKAIGAETAYTPICRSFGYQSNAEGAAAMVKSLASDGDTAGLARDLLEAAVREGHAAETAKIDAQYATLEQARGADAVRAAALALAGKLGEECTRIARGSLITAPADYDPRAGARRAADEMLELEGLASWQTPAIVEAGNLIYAAARCRSALGAAKADAMTARYVGPGAADALPPREYHFYKRVHDNGLKEPASAALCATLTSGDDD